MPLPAIVAVATKLGIEVAKYIIKKQGKKVLKEGAEKQLKKRVAKQTNKTSKKEVDSGLSIKKNSRSGKGKLSRKIPISEKGKGFHDQKYKTTIKVKIKDPKGKYEERKKMRYRTEEIKGLNKGHALARAKSNFPGSAVIKTKLKDK